MQNLLLSYKELCQAEKIYRKRIEMGIDTEKISRIYCISRCMFLAYVRKFYGLYDLSFEKARHQFEMDMTAIKEVAEYMSYVNDSETRKASHKFF